jgi:hypothetical protein
MPGKGSLAVYMEANPSEGPMIGLLRAREDHPRHRCSQARRTKLVLTAVAIMVILAGAFLGLGLHSYLHKGERRLGGCCMTQGLGLQAARPLNADLPTGHMSCCSFGPYSHVTS